MDGIGKDQQSIGDVASAYFSEQFHCAEAVAKAVLNARGECARAAVACATPFGGGFGRSFDEACGALSGGLIAIGQLHGRREPGEDWGYPAALAAMLRDAFAERFGTTRCSELRARFGEAQEAECREIVRFMAEELHALLTEQTEQAQEALPKRACGCS